jgi:transposase
VSKSNQKSRRTRRRFSDEYKAEVVELIRTGNKSLGLVCKDLGLTDSAVRKWVQKSQDNTLKSSSSSGDGESTSDELKRLRSENKQLKAERDILKKATAFFAKDSM